MQRLLAASLPLAGCGPAVAPDDADPATPQRWVLLDVGSVGHLEAGHRLSVYRASQFVGKVEVEAPVARDRARARVLFAADGQRFAAHDAAATRLQ